MSNAPVLRGIAETGTNAQLRCWRALFSDGTEILLNEHSDGVKVTESDNFSKWIVQGKSGAAEVSSHQRLKDFLDVLKYVKG